MQVLFLLHLISLCKRNVLLFLLQDDGDMFDDYDRHMMLHDLGLEVKSICDSLVTFQKDFKRLVGGRKY